MANRKLTIVISEDDGRKLERLALLKDISLNEAIRRSIRISDALGRAMAGDDARLFIDDGQDKRELIIAN
jgi:hypothetical protein